MYGSVSALSANGVMDFRPIFVTPAHDCSDAEQRKSSCRGGSPQRHFMTRIIYTVALILMSFAAPALTTEVTDFLGQKVRLEQPAKKIVALAPHLVENAYSAGAGDLIVAVVDYSDYPPEARKLPRLGSAMAVSVETVLSLQPDLVLAWDTGNNDNLVRQLKRFGLPVYVDEPQTLEDVAKTIRDIGILAGTEKVADKKAQQYLNSLADLRQRYTDEKTVGVFYQVWNDPLQTLNDDHIVSDVISLCGGYNIYGDAVSIAPVINRESILDRDPDIIVASGRADERPQWLDEWLRWPGMNAVRNGHLYVVHADLIQRHTVRILDGAKIFCQHIEKARTQ